jgi:hypothetical protein
MNIEKKFPEDASNSNNIALELFFNRRTNKIAYRDANGILINLLLSTDDVATTESVKIAESYGASAFYGFTRASGDITESLTLPDNSTMSYQGPLTLATGVVLTVPLGTTLTIV